MIQKVSKKIKFLVALIGSLLMTSVSAFGMYGLDGNDWINFLVHGNQFRARMDQLGFTLGNGTIKGTLGVYADQGWMGSILSPSTENNKVDFNPTLSAGIGYTSDMFGIGVGYNFNYVDKYLQVHTPTLVLNALNNSLRIAAPIQVAVTDNAYGSGAGNKFTGVGFNQIELRYYTGIDAFNLIRLDASYMNGTWESSTTKATVETLGLQLRLYFLNTQVGNVTVNPYIRVDYHQALKGDYAGGDFSRNYTLENMYNNLGNNVIDANGKQSDIYDVSPFYVAVKPILSLAASSDVVSLYFEPGLGYAVTSQKRSAAGSVQETTHALTWQAYAEMYVTPVEDLEWYFEMDVNGNVNGTDLSANADLPPVYFETTTGITWYLPSFN